MSAIESIIDYDSSHEEHVQSMEAQQEALLLPGIFREDKRETRRIYRELHRIRNTGLPIVIEDVLGLATRIRLATLRDWRQRSSRYTSGIVIGGDDGLRPLLPTHIPIDEVRRWSEGFVAHVREALERDHFDDWHFMRAKDSSIRAVARCEDLYSEDVKWDRFADPIECLYRMKCERCIVWQAIPDAMTEHMKSSQGTISDEDIKFLGYRARACELNAEAIAEVRRLLMQLLGSILHEAVESVKSSSSRAQSPVCILGSDLDDALRRRNCSVAGYGYRGLRDYFNSGLFIVLRQIHPRFNVDICAIRVLNDMVVYLLEELLLACGCLNQPAETVMTAAAFERGFCRILVDDTKKYAFKDDRRALAKLQADHDKSKSLSERSGLTFDADLVGRLSRDVWNVVLDNNAAVQITSLLEYVMAEILELAGNAARNDHTEIIKCRHIYLAVEGDREIRDIFKHLVLAEGGSTPTTQILVSIPLGLRQSVTNCQSRTTPCISPSCFDHIVIQCIQAMDPGCNISQESLDKLHSGVEGYLLRILDEAYRLASSDPSRTFVIERSHVYGADLQAQLMAACIGGANETVLRLVQEGAMVNASILCLQPLEYATRAGQISVMQTLLECGANSISTKAAILCAAETGDISAMQLLLNWNNDDCNALGPENRSVLQIACLYSEFECCIDVAELLILRGATPGINGRDEIAETSLVVQERLTNAREMYLNPGLK